MNYIVLFPLKIQRDHDSAVLKLTIFIPSGVCFVYLRMPLFAVTFPLSPRCYTPPTETPRQSSCLHVAMGPPHVAMGPPQGASALLLTDGSSLLTRQKACAVVFRVPCLPCVCSPNPPRVAVLTNGRRFHCFEPFGFQKEGSIKTA